MRSEHVTLGVVVIALLIGSVTAGPTAEAAEPTSVTMAGSFQSELGCPGDWQADCAQTHLVYDAVDGVWQQSFSLDFGFWEYKAALDDSWNENYGAGGVPNGANIALTLGHTTVVKFYYSHATHWVTDNVNTRIAVAVGSFQSELGCAGDWDPGCLRSWVQDPDGDGAGVVVVPTLPAGAYDAKVTIGETWDENYGAGGVPGGANIPFTVPTAGSEVTFAYDDTTHVLTIAVLAPLFADGFEGGDTSGWSASLP